MLTEISPVADLITISGAIVWLVQWLRRRAFPADSSSSWLRLRGHTQALLLAPILAVSFLGLIVRAGGFEIATEREASQARQAILKGRYAQEMREKRLQTETCTERTKKKYPKVPEQRISSACLKAVEEVIRESVKRG